MKDSTMETDWYICVKCGERGYALKSNFMQIVVARNKMCSSCIDEKNLLKAKQGRKARTCGSKCRGKLSSKTHFYKGLKKATREADMANVHVFGQGNYVVSIHDKKKDKK